jgi:hypothetical protein
MKWGWVLGKWRGYFRSWYPHLLGGVKAFKSGFFWELVDFMKCHVEADEGGNSKHRHFLILSSFRFLVSVTSQNTGISTFWKVPNFPKPWPVAQRQINRV